jgi:hypothetical protein
MMMMPDQNTETQPRPNLSTEPGTKPLQPEGTSTQPAPNISTEHQREGDARHPSDTLDRGQPNDGPDGIEPKHMPSSAEDIEVAGETNPIGPN